MLVPKVKPTLKTITFVFLALVAFTSVPQVKPATAANLLPYQTLFEDDFSNGLGNWNKVEGSWAAENGHLLGTSDKSSSLISAGDSSAFN